MKFDRPMSRPSWQSARMFAAGAHAAAGQTYGGQPYIVHLDAVVFVLHAAHFGDETLQAACLHDVLEDTRVTSEDLIALGFSETVVAAVEFVTDEPGPSRRERKRATYERVAQQQAVGGPTVIVGLRVKWADRIANIEACLAGDGPLRMYLREADEFRRVYMPVDPITLSDWRFEKLLARYDAAVAAGRLR